MENEINVFIFCKNKQIKEFSIKATKKFNIGDETYIIKKDCVYTKKINDKLCLVSFYTESNPNPYNLKKLSENIGLSIFELDNLISGDIFNILVECQKLDKQKYIFQLAFVNLIFGICALFVFIFGF